MSEIHTEEQENILNTVVTDPNSNYCIDAKAGTGKTYILTKLAERLEQTSPASSLMLAFSKADQIEASNRFPQSVVCKTSNALGYGVYRNGVDCSRPTLKAYKNNEIFKLFRFPAKTNTFDFNRALGILKTSLVVSTIENMKHNSCGQMFDMDIFYSLIRNYSFDFSPYTDEAAAAILDEALEIGRQWAYGKYFKYPCRLATGNTPLIDFDDQIYIPLLYMEGFKKYARVYLDEAQDLAPIQHELLRRSVEKDGKVIIVGDPNQAIYGFRGADANSFSALTKEWNTKPLPLSVNFRCDKTIIEKAQHYVPGITARHDAAIGEVYREQQEDFDWGSVEKNSVITCRMNKPLFVTFYALMQKGKNVRMLGSDLGKGLSSILKSKTSNSSDLRTIVGELQGWKYETINHLEEKAQANPDAAGGFLFQANAVEEKFQCLMIILKAERTKSGALQRLKTMFDDKSDPDITLSSIHRTKGREYAQVYLMTNQLPKAIRERQSEAQKQQEDNLQYVAITRAKHKLVYLDG